MTWMASVLQGLCAITQVRPPDTAALRSRVMTSTDETVQQIWPPHLSGDMHLQSLGQVKGASAFRGVVMDGQPQQIHRQQHTATSLAGVQSAECLLWVRVGGKVVNETFAA